MLKRRQHQPDGLLQLHRWPSLIRGQVFAIFVESTRGGGLKRAVGLAILLSLYRTANVRYGALFNLLALVIFSTFFMQLERLADPA